MKTKRRQMLYDLGKTLLFPPRCPGCDTVLTLGETGFCSKCARSVICAVEPVCKLCGKPIADERAALCTDCARRGGRRLHQNKAAYVYDGAVRQALYRLKYAQARWIGTYFGDELYAAHADWLREKAFDAIVPVPLHPIRERKRGYNQAEVLARALSRRYAEANGQPLPVVPLVRRVENTRPQKELDAVIRRKNLKRAFKLDKSVVKLQRMHSCAVSRDGMRTLYRRVLVADDIFTTGATLDAIAALLVAGGIAQEVCTITAAVGKDI